MIAPPRRTTTSEIAVRRIRLRVAGVAAAGCDQVRSRSAPSARSCCRSSSPSGGESRAIMAATVIRRGAWSSAIPFDETRRSLRCSRHSLP